MPPPDDPSDPTDTPPGLTARQRAVTRAHQLRATEGLTIAQIADRLGLSPKTIAAYFSDPTGEKRDRYKQKQQGRCEQCGKPTTSTAVKRCRDCREQARQRRWTQQTITDAMLAWHDAHGRLPTSYDWNATAAARRPDALRRLQHGDWPPASSVTDAFGSWPAATRQARRRLAKRLRSTTNRTPAR
jgi:AraC-like DNA-binding protein